MDLYELLEQGAIIAGHEGNGMIALLRNGTNQVHFFEQVPGGLFEECADPHSTTKKSLRDIINEAREHLQ